MAHPFSVHFCTKRFLLFCCFKDFKQIRSTLKKQETNKTKIDHALIDFRLIIQ